MHTFKSEFHWPKGLCTSTHSRKPYRRGAGLFAAASLSCCLLASVPAQASYHSLQSIDPRVFAHPRTGKSRIVEGRDFLLRQACLAASWLRSRLRRATTRSNPLIPLLGNPADSFRRSYKGVMGCYTE